MINEVIVSHMMMYRAKGGTKRGWGQLKAGLSGGGECDAAGGGSQTVLRAR